jgi:hypothetical protein
MLIALVVVFVLAYAAIALEHPLKISKSASALIGAGLLWSIYALSTGDHELVSEQLGESLMATAQIVFFLMGAMTIVEVVDAHNGFEVITSRIKTSKLSTLLWLVGDLVHREKRRGQAAAVADARPDTYRHEFTGILHRHPACRGYTGAHTYSDLAGPMAGSGRRASGRYRDDHRRRQRHRR